jgi:hypothetical protein
VACRWFVSGSFGCWTLAWPDPDPDPGVCSAWYFRPEPDPGPDLFSALAWPEPWYWPTISAWTFSTGPVMTWPYFSAWPLALWPWPPSAWPCFPRPWPQFSGWAWPQP